MKCTYLELKLFLFHGISNKNWMDFYGVFFFYYFYAFTQLNFKWRRRLFWLFNDAFNQLKHYLLHKYNLMRLFCLWYFLYFSSLFLLRMRQRIEAVQVAQSWCWTINTMYHQQRWSNWIVYANANNSTIGNSCW